MNRDDDRLPSIQPGFWYMEDDMNPKTAEAFFILWSECRRQAHLKRRQTLTEDASTGRPAKAQLKLVHKKASA